MNVYSVTIDSMTANSNEVKDALLKALEKEGLLKGKAEDVASQYVIIVHEPGWFGKLFAKVRGEKRGSGLQFTVVKVVTE